MSLSWRIKIHPLERNKTLTVKYVSCENITNRLPVMRETGPINVQSIGWIRYFCGLLYQKSKVLEKVHGRTLFLSKIFPIRLAVMKIWTGQEKPRLPSMWCFLEERCVGLIVVLILKLFAAILSLWRNQYEFSWSWKAENYNTRRGLFDTQTKTSSKIYFEGIIIYWKWRIKSNEHQWRTSNLLRWDWSWSQSIYCDIS